MAKKNKDYNVKQIFIDMETELIQSYQRNMSRHTQAELEAGFKWDAWQLLKLQDLRQYQKEARTIVDKHTRRAKDATTGILVSSYTDGIQVADAIIKKFKKGIDSESFSKINRRKLDALIDAINNDFDKIGVSALRLIDDQFRKTVFKAELMYSAGTTNLTQAIDIASHDFLHEGINSIVYSDGKRVNIASYAEVCLRSSSKKAYHTGEGARAAEWGEYLVQVTVHGSTCPKCAPWQGRVLIDDVYAGGKSDGKHALLSEAMAEGLYHPNCRHTHGVYFDGISYAPLETGNAEQDEEMYKAEQKQRYLERKIREWKRVKEGSVDDVERRKAEFKVKQWQAIMRKHINNNDFLSRKYNREKTFGVITG